MKGTNGQNPKQRAEPRHERARRDRAAEQLADGVVPGGFWERTEDGRLRCELCPRRCTLREGQRAFCFVREAREGQVVLSSWGRASGFCVDPIEKKPLNHFFPGSAVLSFGTAGCNLGCRYCQNWDISKARAWDRLADRALPEQVAEAAVRSGARSVAFTYNDPVIFAEYAMDCALAARERGLKTVAVTAGYLTERAREPFFEHLDAVNVDLKAFDEGFYRKLCLGHLQPVLETLQWLRRETNVWLEVTTLVIPGHNDEERKLRAQFEWMVEHLGPHTPLHLTAFHPDFKLLDVPPTPPSTLRRARRLALQSGLRFVYTGNVHDPDGQSTYCPGCGERLIGRSGYLIDGWNLDEQGRCRRCGRPLKGHFEEAPGHWGPKRMPVYISG